MVAQVCTAHPFTGGDVAVFRLNHYIQSHVKRVPESHRTSVRGSKEGRAQDVHNLSHLKQFCKEDGKYCHIKMFQLKLSVSFSAALHRL